MVIGEIKGEALQVADEMLEAAQGRAEPPGTAIDRNQRTARPISDDLRGRFIQVRALLFALGLYDPILGRFDSATVPQADTTAVAAQLRAVAEKLDGG